ncbi:T9SS C-terminal target domain-containing protein [Flavihumibacter petaseus]|uniref:PKD domain-containing protein n=1 Tax=Flavihumibacter petaseus NBRC 106054 TaxID=1220578 RepID=A0A0E9MYJ7_9BACT|nr:T9SS C-terminal target domain-containing protein [Flavihumibacter petaseus]GAO42200.1 hypothetical protein FPE01S_01_12130 [Flavihumibacter petaseus NBRC 106054]
MKLRIALFLLTLLCCTGAYAQFQAAFSVSATHGCSPFSVKFTNQSTGTSASTTYEWDMGNGNLSTIVNPQAIYLEVKSYKVVLTIRDKGKVSTVSQDITVHPLPAFDIETDQFTVCAPTPVQLKVKPATGQATFTDFFWEYGDGVTERNTLGVTQHAYQFALEPSVSVTVTDQYGCHQTVRKGSFLKVLPVMTVAFSAEEEVLCRESDPVRFHNSSAGPGTLSYVWDFGDGTTSTQKEPTHAFNKKGIYSVTLKAISSEGCAVTAKRENLLNVASYKADFRLPEKACENTSLQLISTSSPAANSLTWWTSGTGQLWGDQPAVQIPASENLVVRLIAGFGKCLDTLTKTMPVLPAPMAPEMEVKQLDFCESPYTVQLTDKTPGSVKSEWSYNWYVYPPEYIETGNSIKHDFAYGGQIFWLRTTNKEGCIAEISQNVAVLDNRPMISMDPVFQTCDSVAVTYRALNYLVMKNVKWDLGDGTTSDEEMPFHKYVKPGRYFPKITYETEEGCKGEYQAPHGVIVKGKLEADFELSKDTVCIDEWFTVNNTSKLATGLYDAFWYRWYFNGELKAQTFDKGSFDMPLSQPGVYEIKLEPWDECATSKTKEKVLTVLGSKPRITNRVNTCDGTRADVIFSQETIGGGDSWIWDFGDGKTLTLTTNEPTVTHTYTKSGWYTVTLTVKNKDCSNTSNQMLAPVVLKQTKLELTAFTEKLCKDDPFPIQLSNMDFYYSGYVSIYIDHYEYEDGSRFLGTFRDYIYAYNYEDQLYGLDPTHSKIRAITRNEHGCLDTSNYVPFVVVGATADFTISGNASCFDQPIKFEDASISADSKITKWTWNFGDGTQQELSTNAPVSHRYDQPGNYLVRLSVNDQSGCGSFASTAEKAVLVKGPKADFNVNNEYQLNSTIYFPNNTNTSGTGTVNYEWDFGDGTKSRDPYPSKTYPLAGNYTVTLTAADPATGCRSVATRKFLVKDFRFGFNKTSSSVNQNSCPPLVVQFYNQSINYTRFVWDFGDGQTLENVSYPSHVYENPGNYKITLYVYGYNGLEGTVVDSVRVSQPAPIFSADKQEYCSGEPVILSSATKGVTQFTWDFGDGQFGSGQGKEVNHTYAQPGTYYPVIMVTDTNGCIQANKTAAVVIRKNPEVNISPAQSEVCKGSSLQLTATGGVSYEWSPSAGLNRTNIANPVATPLTDSRYTVSVKDDIGCKGSASKDIKIVSKEEISLTASTASLCLGETAQLTGSGATRYWWIGETAGLSSTGTPSPIAKPLTATDYVLVGTDHLGCFTDTARVHLDVWPYPTVDAGPGASLIAGNSFTIPVLTSPDVTTYEWTPSQYLSCQNCAQPVSRPMADMTYTVTVSNVHGCTASDTVQLKLVCAASGASIPNAFSPNGDGKNDRFVIQGVARVISLVIMDRWGNKVYENRDFFPSERSECWDGTIRGTPASAGAYVYYAVLECKPGETITRKGSLILVR